MFAVGSIVRAKRGSKRCRAMVATVGGTSSVGAAADPKDEHESETTLCILWEPIYPNNLISERCSFLITPKSIPIEPEQDEATVKVDTVEGLLPFEIDQTATGSDRKVTATSNNNIALWKERGDQLLRLGDASAATSYYEKALFDSSLVSIGGTIIISVEGFPRIADVDCVDDGDDGGTIDATLLHNDDEKTVKQSAVLLSILESDATKVQERILLNLARCMLQLSDLDVSNRPKYLKSAILATTLAITISLFREQQQKGADDESLLLPTNAQTALVLRCKAYTGMSKWSKATSDARKLVNRGSNEEQGQKLLVGIERKKKLRSKTDKKLAKEICMLVQSATTAASNDDSSRTSVSPKITSSKDTTRQTRNVLSSSNTKDNKCNADCGEMSERNATSCLQHQEAFSNSRSLSILPLVLGFSSTCFFVALVTVLISILIAKVNIYYL
jgi:hypothetical protein